MEKQDFSPGVQNLYSDLVPGESKESRKLANV